MEELAPVVAAGLLPAEAANGVRAAFEGHREVFEGVIQARLAHSDVHPRHVFAHQLRTHLALL